MASFDAETGKELWKKRITILLVDGLSEADAAKAQVAIDLALAMYDVSEPWSHVGRGVNSIDAVTDVPTGQEPADKPANHRLITLSADARRRRGMLPTISALAPAAEDAESAEPRRDSARRLSLR